MMNETDSSWSQNGQRSPIAILSQRRDSKQYLVTKKKTKQRLEAQFKRSTAYNVLLVTQDPTMFVTETSGPKCSGLVTEIRENTRYVRGKVVQPYVGPVYHIRSF